MKNYVPKRRHSIAKPRPVHGGYAQLSQRQRRAKIALSGDQVRCEECKKPVVLRADGRLKNHRPEGRNGYLCIGGGTENYETE